MSIEEHIKEIKDLADGVLAEARSGFVRGNQLDTSGFTEAYGMLTQIIRHAEQARDIVNSSAPDSEDMRLGGKKRRRRQTRRLRKTTRRVL